MEYVVPLLIVLVIVLIVVGGLRIAGRRNRPEKGSGTDKVFAEMTSPDGKGRDITRQDAEEASARLDAEAHRRVYSLIAQHQVIHAVKEYRLATRTGLREAAASVAALSQFPQPTPEQRASSHNPQLPHNASADAALPQKSAVEQPVAAPTSYRYRAIVSRGDDIREVTSTRLNEQIFTSIKELATSGNYDDAASLLRRHADIGEQEALEFVGMISVPPSAP